MFEADPLSRFHVVGATDRVTREDIRVAGMPFSKAVRFAVTQAGDNPWTMQAQAKTETPIRIGDVLLASFWIRCERSSNESGEGQTEFVLELARDPWTKTISHAVRAGGQWQEIHIPFIATQEFEPGQAQVIFRLGYSPQTLDVAELRLHNFERKVKVEDLPRTKISYRGREADAPWRAAAEARIDEHRKGNLTVSVVDAQGNPKPGAKVRIRQVSHDFWFGTAIAAQPIAHPESDKRYIESVTRLFNSVVLENNLKWKPLAGDWGSSWTMENAISAIDWAKKNGLNTRGHVLVWPSWGHLPGKLAQLKDDKEKLKKAIEEHIRDVAGKMAGRLDHWDVVNEPYDNHDLMDILGDEVMIDWFKIARETDPKAKLYLNDYAILSGGGGETGHRAHFEKTARFLIEGGAPIDGLGMQGHFGSALTAPDDLERIIDRYAALGKPIIVTEYDITADDEDLAADYTRDFYTLLFSHPSIEGIMMWGFWDTRHWKRSAPIYDYQWQEKKTGTAYRELVFGKWMTNREATTDSEGKVAIRGFLGNYEITSGAGNSTRVHLDKQGSAVKLTVK